MAATTKLSADKRFKVSKDELTYLTAYCGEYTVKQLELYYDGSVEKLCERLGTSPTEGLLGDDDDIASRVEKYGVNVIPQKPPRTYLQLAWETIRDNTIRNPIWVTIWETILKLNLLSLIFILSCVLAAILCCYLEISDYTKGVHDPLMEGYFQDYVDISVPTAASQTTAISAGMGQLHTTRRRRQETEEYDWIINHLRAIRYWLMLVELVLMVLVVFMDLVLAGFKWKKERKFCSLHNQIDLDHSFTVLRAGGQLVQLRVRDLVVGDIVLVNSSDLVPADGIVIQSNDLKTDESALTGKFDLVKKSPTDDPRLLLGTRVIEGSAKMVITAVGVNSHACLILA